ncbi:MAG TPA: secretin N-terminal domain-containing protein [Solimonas sp.]|nr:secretin N-terminal domain-containing protein [Solimonas sp.]
MNLRRLILLICLLPLTTLAQSRLEVIDLRYRSPQELLPLLRPLVEPEGSVSAWENQLVVRATPAQLAELRQLLEQLDRAPRQLLISVRQGGVADSRQQSAGVGGVYRDGEAELELRLRDRSSHGDSSASQQLRVEEGREAQLMVGQSRPYSRSWRRPDGVIVQQTETVSGGSGITVLPRLQGDRVQLEIHAQQQLPGTGGVASVQRTSSIVSGRLGEWFEIGGAVQQASQSSQGILYGGTASASSSGSVMVRVDLLP